MHNLKIKKSIALTTIKNSLSKTSSPAQLTFPCQRWVVGSLGVKVVEGGGRGGQSGGDGRLLRYARWISSFVLFFTKLDNNKSNNNNDNNLKSNIFCLCSILLIHINRGFFFSCRFSHYVYRFTHSEDRNVQEQPQETAGPHQQQQQ